MSSFPLPVRSAPGDGSDVLGYAFQRQRQVHETGTDRRLRHAEDDRALLILRDCLAARHAQCPKPLGSVIAHSGQDDREDSPLKARAIEPKR